MSSPDKPFVPGEAPRARFVVDPELSPEPPAASPSALASRREADPSPAAEGPLQSSLLENGAARDAGLEDNSGAWRDEVAARLDRYRARRRPRAPRYPSLRLKFEPPDSTWSNTDRSPDTPALPPASLQAVALNSGEPELTISEPVAALPEPDLPETATGKLIEFPRSYMAPSSLDELAEPILGRPRILDVPEVAPPPPALGGMLIEQEQVDDAERRPGFEIPLQAAPFGQRILAAAVDAVVVLMALGAFGYLFYRITGLLLPLKQAAGMAALVGALLWWGYQYLLLVYAGSTPGLKLARLHLAHFDGSPANRRTRRWRVAASALSGAAVALGYLWCFLDEDQLCWHDRITHTYMAPRTK